MAMARHKTLPRRKSSLILEATAADGTDILAEQTNNGKQDTRRKSAVRWRRVELDIEYA